MFTYSCAGCNRIRFREDYIVSDSWARGQSRCSCGSKTVKLRQESDIRVRRGTFKRAPKFTRREQRFVRQMKESAGVILWNIYEELSSSVVIPRSFFQSASIFQGTRV